MLSDEQARAMESHVEQCDLCSDRLMAVAGGAQFLLETRSQLSSVAELPTLGDVACNLDDVRSRRLEQMLREIPLGPTDDPDSLGRLGGYEICGLIGRGGMGVVLKGWDAALDRFVAIKVLSPVYAHHAEMRLRFAREARAAAAIVHENVVAIFGVDSEYDLPFLVMPYVRGESLQGRMDRTGPLQLEEILEIALQVARGLQAAHDQGVVHRDIKPGNILIPCSVSRVMITDFGLARSIDDSTLTNSGLVAGTPAYMSPEQAKGESVQVHSDLFSLGSVMYAMCAGVPPFQADGSYATLRKIIEQRHRPLSSLRRNLPPWFIAIVDRLLEKNPGQRYISAAELAKDLEQALVYLRQPKQCQPPWPKKRLANPRALHAMLVVAILLTGAVFGGRWMFSSNSSSILEESAQLELDLDRGLEQLENEIDLLDKELVE
jgi:serine/threonine-protein kinase